MAEDTPLPIFHLIREPFRDDATMGTFLVPWGKYITLERPWLNNASGVSCYPEGTYLCGIRYSNAFHKDMIGVRDVPGRSGILIHNGSFIENSLGCTLIGKTAFVLKKPDGTIKRGIGLSKFALAEFMAKVGRKPFTLVVTRRGE